MTGTTAALLLLAGLAGAGAPPETDHLPDGLEIVVHRLPGAPRSALRLVVRSGGASDPAGRAGLAHLVEHLLFASSNDDDGTAVFAAARAAGAEINAHTTPDFTQFELDAPAATFPALAGRLLRLLTDPAWDRSPIATERGVLETEVAYRQVDGLLTLVDWALFPAPIQGGPLAGTSVSRAALTVEDAQRFFVSEYVAPNMTVVFAGDLQLEEARALVASSFRLPPALPEEAVHHAPEPPLLPIEQRLQGGITVTLLGYVIDSRDRPHCESIAALAELRLTLSLSVGGPMVPGVSVSCPVLRGHPLVLAAVYTTTLDAGDLVAMVGAAFADLADRPPSLAERKAVDARLDAGRRLLLSEPDSVAERLGRLTADGSDPRPLGERLHPARLPSAAALAATVARSFVAQRRFLVHVTPTEM